MHFFTPNHVQLLNSCYPPSSTLLSAAPDYLPNSQELSRLTYYASNHPSKLTKLSAELEKRLRLECKKARAGNLRSRASLLISLSIFRSLAIECRRDIGLLSLSLVASVDVALSSIPDDLEVYARAASVFVAWTTYTDGHLIGTDSNLTSDYNSILRQFAELCCSSIADRETRNRTRLIGLAALMGALSSEALYNDSHQFRVQIATIMRPILVNVFQADIDTLNEQAAAVKDAPLSPYLAEFRTRPAMERRAASIHIHIDGDKGPLTADVSSASLRALYSLLDHCNGAQVGYIVQSSFDSINDAKYWKNMSHCCWFAQKAVDWSQYQYRYAVPTWLVERLVNPDTSNETPLLATLTAMVTTVFNSSTPLVNLSTSDINSNLVTLLLRRVANDLDDPLLPALVDCISSLGRHVYYSDQIQDLAAELINRIVAIEVQGVLNHGKSPYNKSRSQALRYILAALLGLVHAANQSENSRTRGRSGSVKERRSSSITRTDNGPRARGFRRTRVPLDIWQDTLSLLCDSNYAVRADYYETLLYYLSNEMPKHSTEVADGDGAKPVRQVAEGPLRQAVQRNIVLNSRDLGVKFLNAAHAYIYILATSSSLGLTSQSQSSLDDPRQSNAFSTIEGGSGADEFERPSFSTLQGPRLRKVSVVQRLLDRTPSRVTSSSAANLTDYAYILEILTAVHEQMPIRALLTGIPMLTALDEASNGHLIDDIAVLHRINVIQEIVTRVWSVIGKVWNIPEILEITQKILSSASDTSQMPPILAVGPGNCRYPAQAVEFPAEPLQVSPWPRLDIQAAISAITANQGVQDATGLDRESLLRRLSYKWTADAALKDLEPPTGYENTARGDGISPLLKISPALMHIENISLQSLARSTRGVGVTDLRDALEGRNSMSNPNLARPASISTLEHAPSMTTGESGNLRLAQTRPKSRTKKRPAAAHEVRDVLNRLGIAKPNGNLLKASFPSLQKSDQRTSIHKT